MICCPLCGGPFENDGLVVLEDRGLIIAGDRMTTLTGRELELFMRLFSCRPRTLSNTELIEWMYQLDHAEPQIKIIDVFVCKIRKKVKPLGVTIHTHWGKGYSMGFVGEARLVKKEVAA